MRHHRIPHKFINSLSASPDSPFDSMEKTSTNQGGTKRIWSHSLPEWTLILKIRYHYIHQMGNMDAWYELDRSYIVW